jgi:hypothetical protein
VGIKNLPPRRSQYIVPTLRVDTATISLSVATVWVFLKREPMKSQFIIHVGKLLNHIGRSALRGTDDETVSCTAETNQVVDFG